MNDEEAEKIKKRIEEKIEDLKKERDTYSSRICQTSRYYKNREIKMLQEIINV